MVFAGLVFVSFLGDAEGFTGGIESLSISLKVYGTSGTGGNIGWHGTPCDSSCGNMTDPNSTGLDGNEATD